MGGIMSMFVPYNKFAEEYAKRVEIQFLNQTEMLKASMISTEASIKRIEVEFGRRFDLLNQTKEMLHEIMTTMMPRTESNARYNQTLEKIEAGQIAVNSRLDTMNIHYSSRIEAINHRLDTSEGSGKGLKAGWAYLVGGIGLMSSIAAVLAVLFSQGHRL